MVKEFVHKGKVIKILPQIDSAPNSWDNINNIQRQHINGELDVYEPIVAYSEKWETKYDKSGQYVSARPIPGTRRRNDLPPIYMQWKEAAES